MVNKVLCVLFVHVVCRLLERPTRLDKQRPVRSFVPATYLRRSLSSIYKYFSLSAKTSWKGHWQRLLTAGLRLHIDRFCSCFELLKTVFNVCKISFLGDNGNNVIKLKRKHNNNVQTVTGVEDPNIGETISNIDR